jgi:hypothetical protein
MRGRRATALLAALAAAACATAAPAAGAPAGRTGLYGGGAVDDYLQFVSVRVLPNARFRAHATLVTSCAPRFGDTLTESVSVRAARLTDGSAYSATTSFSDDLEPGLQDVGGLHAEGTIAFSVRVLRAGVARGVVRVRSTYTDPATGAEIARCDTGRIRWFARRPPDGAGDGKAPRRAGTQRGTTDQAEPFLMRLTRRGRFVERAGMTVRIGCPSGIGLPLDVVAHRVHVRRGRFGAADGFERAFTYPDGTRVAEHYSWELRGRLGKSGARGTFQMHGVVRRESDGEAVDSCDTGPVAWRAVR